MTIDTILSSILNDYDYMTSNSYSKKINSYKLYQENNNIIFKCLAPGILKEDVDISFDSKRLIIKSLKNSGDEDFKAYFNESIYLGKKINIEESFADLSQGILKITMPLDNKEVKHKIFFK